MENEERNALRALFERVWERRKAEFTPWIEAGDGFLSKMARYSIAQKQVRAQMKKPQD
jgi:hypothetical protein